MFMEAIEAHNDRMPKDGKPGGGSHEPASPEFQQRMQAVFAAERAKRN